jgi:signal transduction histidine kinase
MPVTHAASMSASALTKLRAIAMAGGLLALIGGTVSFLGWPLDLPRLTDWLNTGVSIQPNAALLITLAGAAILLLQFGKHTISTILGAIIATVGLLTLSQYIIGVDLGINHQLLFGREWGDYSTVTPGRMGPPASTSHLLIGSCIIILALSQRGAPFATAARRAVPMFALLVCTFMLFSLMGYLFGARQFYTVPWLSAIALQTSLMLMGLGVALIVSVPEHQPVLLLRERTGAAMLGRVLLPFILMLPPLQLWLRVVGFELELYDLGTGRALSAVGMIIVMVAVLWIALRMLRRHELEVLEIEARQNVMLAKALAERTQELTEANERQRRAEALSILGSLSSGIAHDLGNLLMPLRFHVDRLRSDADVLPADERRESIDAVTRNVGYIQDLVTRLRRTMSDATQSDAAGPAELIDLAEWCSGAEEFLRQNLPQPITLTCQIQTGLPAVRLNKVALTQAAYNIVQNASKAICKSGKGQHITLRAQAVRAPDGKSAVQIEIRDDGPGMSEEALASCMEPRFTTDNNSGSLGLGLSLVKAFVESSGGEIEVFSPPPKEPRGTAVVLRLPSHSTEQVKVR